jgi:hypothetical protein
MQTWEQYEKAQAAAESQLEKLKLDLIRCPCCDSTFFEQIEVSRYQVNHNIIIGQDVPKDPKSMPYKLLKCIRCNDILEPRIIHNTRDVGRDAYDELLDELEGKGDTRKGLAKEQKPGESPPDALPSEKL